MNVQENYDEIYSIRKKINTINNKKEIYEGFLENINKILEKLNTLERDLNVLKDMPQGINIDLNQTNCGRAVELYGDIKTIISVAQKIKNEINNKINSLNSNISSLNKEYRMLSNLY